MSLKASEFEFIAQLLKRESAIVLEAGKEYLVELRLGTLAEKEGHSSYHSLILELIKKKDAGLVAKVVDAMTTNETLFFRDLKPYDYLQKHLLPELMARPQQHYELNIWSAACSTGQEPYSIAMLIHQNFPNLVRQWNYQFYATDLSNSCLDYARAAVYNQFEVNRGLPIPYLVRYFAQTQEGWALKEEIKRMFAFQQLNLIKEWGFMPKMDIIFLRNVLIYFDVPTKKEILAKMRQQLKPDGYLFLGSAETPINLDPKFKRVDTDLNVNCYQVLP